MSFRLSNLLNKRGNSMFLRLNVRETNMLSTLAIGGATGIDARTLARLQALGLVNSDFGRDRTGPVTAEGLAWIKSNLALPGRQTIDVPVPANESPGERLPEPIQIIKSSTIMPGL